MAVTEQQRHGLANRAHEVLGVEPATTLMELLPPAGWGDVVTRELLDARFVAQQAEIDARFAELRAEMHTGFAKVGAEFAKVGAQFAEVEAQFAELRTELHKELRDLYVRGLTGIGILIGAATAISGLFR